MRARMRWIAVAAALCAGMLVLAGAAPALAKSYAFPAVEILGTVERDGSLSVTENRTVEFDGDFSWGVFTIDHSRTGPVEVLGVEGPDGAFQPTEPTGSEAPGTYAVTDDGSTTTIRLGLGISNETIPFTFKYRIADAAKRWADTGELYWMAIGTGWEVPTEKVQVRVAVPGAAKSDIRVWAHGPLTGEVQPSDQGIVATVEDLPAQTFVELRTLFPASVVADAPVIDQPHVDDVLAEEGRLADEANALRRTARFKMWVGSIVGIGFPLMAAAVTLWLFLAFGREYRSSLPEGAYIREVPSDLPPALVGALWRMGSVTDDDMAAQIMDLSLRGVIAMRPVTIDKKGGFLGIGGGEDSTYELTLDRSKAASLTFPDDKLVKMLFDDIFDGRDTITIAEMEDIAKKTPQSFTSSLNSWKQAVAADASRRGFMEKRGLLIGVVTLIGLACGGVAIWAGGLTGAWWLYIGIPVGVVIFFSAFTMSRRAKEANELYARYRALRDYMRDFSRMQEKPPMSVVLWERFLVLAVVFGIADQVISDLRVVAPEIVRDPSFQTAYWWAYSSGAGYRSPVSALSTGFVTAAAAASSKMSSSSGGGGGFSGGGGGGGGGTGGGFG